MTKGIHKNLLDIHMMLKFILKNKRGFLKTIIGLLVKREMLIINLYLKHNLKTK